MRNFQWNILFNITKLEIHLYKIHIENDKILTETFLFNYNKGKIKSYF